MTDYTKDPMILRQIIMDHYEYPRNNSLIDNPDYLQKHMASESCIDDIHVQALIEDEILKDIRFSGVACTISTASTSMMTELLKNKSLTDAKKIISEYFSMIDGQAFDEALLDEAIALRGVATQPNRIKCATIGWQGISDIIEKSEKGHE